MKTQMMIRLAGCFESMRKDVRHWFCHFLPTLSNHNKMMALYHLDKAFYYAVESMKVKDEQAAIEEESQRQPA